MERDQPAAHQVLYASAATDPFSAQDLRLLLLKARVNNKRLNVTGMLLHHTGSFFQILEGDPAVVEGLFAQIERDKRHRRVVVLSRGLSEARAFGDWSMGFVEGGDGLLAKIPGFNDFFRRGFELTRLSEEPSRVKELFTAFRGGRFRQYVDA